MQIIKHDYHWLRLLPFQISRSADLDDEKKESLRLLALDKLDDFLQNHELRIRIPKEISAGEISTFVPRVLTKNLPEEIEFPLADSSDQVTGRGEYFFTEMFRTISWITP